MTPLDIRKQIEKYLDELSSEKLEILIDIISDLLDDDDATNELLNIDGFEKRFEEAKKNVQDGKGINIEQTTILNIAV